MVKLMKWNIVQDIFKCEFILLICAPKWPHYRLHHTTFSNVPFHLVRFDSSKYQLGLGSIHPFFAWRETCTSKSDGNHLKMWTSFNQPIENFGVWLGMTLRFQGDIIHKKLSIRLMALSKSCMNEHLVVNNCWADSFIPVHGHFEVINTLVLRLRLLPSGSQVLCRNRN